MTTSNCRDIQIKPEFTVLVKVCFQSTGCQRANTFAALDKWTVVATNVRDGVPFRFQFDYSRSLDYSGAF
ncbi:hypothetical protein ACFPH6_31385 [Streptomyces xiangluensis]|uniref:Uncharacterized protein n=1 Tax=Streptomyces xiangluensis TaxID=2665720 RepID=A0ABV8YUQ8_9ACTN